MKRLLLTSALLMVVYGCDRTPILTGPRESAPPALGIFDGAHGGGNQDFFFLPPMVPNPNQSQNPTYKSGAFNPNLRPRVEICLLREGACGPIVRQFAGNDISLGDQQYRVDWDTKSSSLYLDSLYRIEVFVGSVSLGFADVDPVSNGSELRNVQTGENIGLVNGRTLPIRFRIQNGALCDNPDDCVSTTVSGAEGGVVTVPSGEAGAQFPEDWLPVGVTEVTVTIERIQLASNQSPPELCHPSPLPQYNCYEYTTDPVVPQFAKDVRVGMCIDEAALPLRDALQLFSTSEVYGTRALENVPVDFLNCGGTIGAAPGTVRYFAQQAQRVLGSLFLPREAWALDRGLGGLTDAFSRIGWMLVAELDHPEGPPITTRPGETLLGVATVLVMTAPHDEEETAPTPIPGVAVEFSVGSNGGSIGGQTSAFATSNSDGYATVPWTLGPDTGTYTITATLTGASNSPVVFTATAALPDLVISSGAPTVIPTMVAPGGSVTLSAWSVQNVGQIGLESGIRNGFYLSSDSIITAQDLLLGQNNNTAGVLGAGQQFNWGGPTLTIPSTVAPGRYWIGVLVDDLGQVAESDETNNFVSVPLCVASVIDFEHTPGCIRTTAGEMITNQFAPLGLIASFRAVEVGGVPVTPITSLQLNRGVAVADVDPTNTSLTHPGPGTGGWFNGTLVLSLPSTPDTVRFIARYNASVPLADLRAFGVDGEELDISASRSSTTYFACAGCVEFREETITFANPGAGGMARIEVFGGAAVVFLDDVRIRP